MFLLIMQTEEIFTEIVFQVTPDGVNMVGVILRIVIFYQEKWTVETVIVRFTAVLRTGPGKVDRSQTGFIQLTLQ